VAHQLKEGAALLHGGRDVEQHQLVDALLGVAGGQRHGVAGVAQVDKVGALNGAAVLHVEAGNEAFGKHGSGK
jgi:hypothetical protein